MPLVKPALLLSFLLALTGCAESRYQSNLQRAAVTRWTRLSRSDFEQVVHLVSDSTHQPIIGITTVHSKTDMRHLHVITGFSDSDIQRWHGFHLEKRADGWHITSQGEISHFLAQMILSDDTF